ncbi:transcription factor-like 5 protein [Bombina bombina]|uniref:transcription factor-like 5 protein n=1 Tax=Bombina bombina TaxID=8345 RepID=UPI00235A7FA5|nr:transcription factor-like 5 protein [Bombina bombina]
MSISTPELPETPNTQTVSSDSTPSSGPGSAADVVLNEQTPCFTATDLSLVEMTEIEYTQLQNILYSHMEAQASEAEFETRPNSAFFTVNNPPSLPQYPSTNINQSSFTTGISGGHPVTCQSAASESNVQNNSNQSLDFQELRMMLSEDHLPKNNVNMADTSMGYVAGDPSGSNFARMQHADNAGKTNEDKENVPPVLETRPKSSVRVRLEDRFNCMQSEIPRCPESQESGVNPNNMAPLVQHSPELMCIPQQSKCSTVMKNKAAAPTTALQFTYPCFSNNPYSAGNSSSSQSSNTRSSYPLLEAVKHQEIPIPGTFSFCYQQEIESTKQALASRAKAIPEQVWIKVGEALCKQSVNKRSHGYIPQFDSSMERQFPREIQNTDAQNPGPENTLQFVQTNVSEKVSGIQQGASSQRREKHNRMERDRRKRIRICCDELNHLVPFCNTETDKATTLQWTTAFLKYIQERHGDSFKKEFENVFCGSTGRRLKVASEMLRKDFALESSEWK